MYYNSYHFLGMHFIWWFVWGILLFLIFAIPYKILGQGNKKDTTGDILKKRFASGEINKEEYQETKKILEG